MLTCTSSLLLATGRGDFPSNKQLIPATTPARETAGSEALQNKTLEEEGEPRTTNHTVVEQ